MKTLPLLFPAALCAALQLTPGMIFSAAAQRLEGLPAPGPGAAAAPAPAPVPDASAGTSAGLDSTRLLREALFEEQAMRDPGKAAAGYEKIIAAYDAERVLAATALYRLAEVRRAQGRNDLAAALYRRIMTEFPGHDPLARLSRENLAALGVKDLPGTASADSAVPEAADEQSLKIAELNQMLKDSPDLALGSGEGQPLHTAAWAGQARVVEFLMKAGAKSSDKVFEAAVSGGHLKVCEILLTHGANVNGNAESPDAGSLLLAVNFDRMEVLRLLLEKGADPNQGASLRAAVISGRTGMLRLLLEKGADPAKKSQLLTQAVNAGRAETLSLLLANGADLNMVENVYGNTPLYLALKSGKKEMADLLLAAKASLNLPPPAKSPLYFAVANGQLEVARRLIGLGADVRVRCIDSKGPIPNNPNGSVARMEDYSASTDPDKAWTLLHAAVLSQSPQMVDLLLASGAGADLETPGGALKITPLALAVSKEAPSAILEALLRAGANPNVRDLEGNPVLLAAGHRPEGEKLVRLMLERGVDVKARTSRGNRLLEELWALRGRELPVLRLLLHAGADPGQILEVSTGTLGVRLAREFQYPQLATQGQVTLSLPEGAFVIPLAKSADQPGTAPASLAEMLLQGPQARWIEQLPPDWSTLHLFRRDADGQLKEQVVKDWMSGSAPALQWGDIVEFVSPGWESTDESITRSFNYSDGLPDEVRTRLQSSLIRHVTVTLNGQTWPMTLRGALNVYNPLKPEAPLTDAVSLMNLMGGQELRWYHAAVKVKRQAGQGGGEITSKLRGGANIPLKEGDALELVGEPSELCLQGGGGPVMRSPDHFGMSGVSDIVLLSPGLPFSKSITVTSNTGQPTLVEYLAASWPVAEPWVLEKMTAAEKVRRATELSGKSAVEALTGERPQSVLPHPDWSQLKIRRLAESGEIIEIPVNLAAAIAACTEATTPEEARKADVPMMPADVILLPVRQDQKDQSWTGWDPETVRFFSKALSMQVTLADEDGSFRALNLEYLPLRHVDTPAGLLGLPAVEPAHNKLTKFFVSQAVEQAAPGKTFAWLQRAGSDKRGNEGFVALLPGDTIGLKNSPATPSVASPGRVRKVLPPPPPVQAPPSQ